MGSYLKDKTGAVWRIDKGREGHWLMVNRAGDRKHVTPKPATTAVTLLEPTEPEAVDALQRILGAIEMGKKDPTLPQSPWRVPRFKEAGPGVLVEGAAHLLMFHGVFGGDIKSPAAMVEAHNELHRDPAKGHQLHEHAGGNPASES